LIFKFIFKDIYPFAGELRNEDISKGNFRFAHFRFIVPQTNQLLDELKKITYRVYQRIHLSNGLHIISQS